MKTYIVETIDYTLKRKGDRWYTLNDEADNYVNFGGCWKNRKAAMKRLNEMGLEYAGTRTIHQNYGHWAGFEFAKPVSGSMSEIKKS